MTLDGVLEAVVDRLGARRLEASGGGLRFRYAGAEFRLHLADGPVGPHVMGRMRLQVAPEWNLRDALAGLSLSSALHDVARFPLWFGIDPVDSALCLFFCAPGVQLDAAGLSCVVGAVAALRTVDVHELTH